MNRARACDAGRLAALLAGALLGLHSFSSCTERPEPPSRTNPFDPGNPNATTDPIAVRAAIVGRSVEVSWNAVAISGRSGYRIYRQTPSDTAFVPLETVGPNET